MILCGSVFVVGCADPCEDGRCTGQLVVEEMPDGTLQADIVGARDVLPEGFELYSLRCTPQAEIFSSSWSVEELTPYDWPLTVGEAPVTATENRGATLPTIEPGRRYGAGAWIPFHDPSKNWASPPAWRIEFMGEAMDVDIGHESCGR
ncbi:MAG: hypothetical protein H6734_10185 [Alphaproteobacteria bacterium]|nr:hypothetical protein [Alphaproteobacteria bacterium]